MSAYERERVRECHLLGWSNFTGAVLSVCWLFNLAWRGVREAGAGPAGLALEPFPSSRSVTPRMSRYCPLSRDARSSADESDRACPVSVATDNGAETFFFSSWISL